MTPARVLFTRTRYDFDLILLSQRVGSFREQVGFPITDGLAHGCEIIATSETGVAGSLAEHGHSVVAPEAPASRVADEIGAAFDRAGGVRAPCPTCRPWTSASSPTAGCSRAPSRDPA